MIPKIIHYCWFGKEEKNDLAQRCIKSWGKYCPDYQIVEWNEENYNLRDTPSFVRLAIKKKLWAFATDYIRYDIVYRNGGIYFDTDVELFHNLDQLLENSAFFGFQERNGFSVNSGSGFGAEKGNSFMEELMRFYNSCEIVRGGTFDFTSNNIREKEIFAAHGLIDNGESQMLDNGVFIYAKDYFAAYNKTTRSLERSERTIAVHWFGASWKDAALKIKKDNHSLKKRANDIRRLLAVLKRMLGVEQYNKLRVGILNFIARHQ